MRGVFQLLTLFGIALCVGTAWTCAMYAGVEPGFKVGDLMGLRHRWRGALQIGLALTMIGLAGLGVIEIID